jgi:transcriptional regulator with XRE-family HTH domain
MRKRVITWKEQEPIGKASKEESEKFDIQKQIADKLKPLVLNHELSQNAIGFLAGVKATTISRILSDKKSNPTIAVLHQICFALGITLDELFKGIGNQDPKASMELLDEMTERT